MDIIAGYCERWDTPLRTSKHHYLERLGKAGHRVLYLEGPASVLTMIRRPGEFLGSTLGRVVAGTRQVEENVWALTGVVPLPYHPALGPLFDRPVINEWNQKSTWIRLRRALEQLGFGRPTVLSYYPLLLPLLTELNPRRVVLHLIDEWQGLPGSPRSMAELTRQMLRRADLTIATSQHLVDRYGAQARDISLLRHGTDVELFKGVVDGSVCSDPRVTSLGSITVGYYGLLSKLEFELVRQVARSKPEWSFVFLGPLKGTQGLGRLPRLPPNVHVWDAWRRDELPGFLSAIDAFWMPFRVDDLTEAMCPIKLFEVLSAGVPTVSTDLAETRAVGGRHVRYAQSADEHLHALMGAAREDCLESRFERSTSVAAFDWSARFMKFEELLVGDLERQTQPPAVLGTADA